MLLLEAKITFYTKEDWPDALTHYLDAEAILRPSINLGDGYLFSGQIKALYGEKVYMRGEYYNVLIEGATIHDEAYEVIKHLLTIGRKFTIQTAFRIVGSGNITDFLYY